MVAMGLKIHDMKGNRNVGEQLTALEELGIGTVEDAELNGVVKRDENGHLTGGARQAVNIAAHGTDALKSAVKDGSIDAATAEALITASHTELGAATLEERAALIDGILERAKGDAALARKMADILAEQSSAIRTGESAEARGGNEKPGIGNEKPGIGNAKPKTVSIAKEGIEYRDAKARLDEQKGREFSNSRTGISARLSATGARKLISDAAVAKSVANGFTRRQHNEIAANVGALFEDASLAEARPDRAGDANIKSIKRFITPIEVDGREAVAWITVKESTEHGHRIYSVEGIKLAALSPSMRRALADRNSADTAAVSRTDVAPTTKDSVSNRGVEVNEALDALAERAKAEIAAEERLNTVQPSGLGEISGCKLTSIEGGKLGCSRFRGMTAEFEESGGVEELGVEDNSPTLNSPTHNLKKLSVRGLGEGQLAKPGNWADGAVLVAELQRVAEKNGAAIKWSDEATAIEAAGLLNKVEREGLEKARARLETRAKLFDVLARSALDTGVTFDEASFRKALEESPNGRKYRDNHGSIYGFASPDGTLHFNPIALDYNIPIHEYGHLALESLKGVNRRLWERGMELVKGSDYYKSIKEQAETEGHEYSYLKGDEAGICDEALATLIGDNGEKLVEAKGVGAELKAWLKDFWKAFKGAFGLADLGEAQIEKMTLGEFVDAVNAELLRGKEFGTRKAVPLKEKSIKRYDEANGSGSNGMLRWKNDRGRLFDIPVDMERTRPGGKVFLATDDANITDWIAQRLDGVELRMSKSGEIYVKGRNGFEGELAEIFGRYPKAGQNDGIGEQLAEDLQNAALRDITPDQIVDMLLKDRANYDEWVKATRDGRGSLEDAKAEEYYADQAERAEYEARRRWEDSGMDVPEYILSRIEEGEPGFDLEWETMRELAHDEAEGRFAVGGRVAASNMGIKGAAEAEAMEKTGADREKIWRETGWWKGKDGKWRFELPRMRREAWHGDPEERHFTGGGDDFYRYRLTELVKNDDFFKAYPQAKKITVEFHKGMPTNVGGNFNEATLTIKLPQKYQVITDYAKYGLGEGKAAGLNAAGAKTIEHELQHAVQLFESFAKGGSPSDPVRPYALDGDTGHALSVFAEANGMDVTNDRHLAIIASNAQKIASDQTRGEMPKRLVEAFEAAAKEAGKTPAEFSDEINRLYDSHTDSPMGQYFKLAGEVEARNAQFRANMTPEERAATPPWETEDVPESRQIVKFAVGRAVGPSALGDGKQRYYEVPFDKAVDKIVKNKKPIGNEQVFVSETPKVFADIGFARLPIMMTQKHVLTISSDAASLKKLGISGNAHDMKQALKQVPGAIRKPLMIIASETKPDSGVVAITQLKDRNGKSVIVPIEVAGEGKVAGNTKIDAHIMTSAYGKDNAWSKLVANAIEAERNGKVGVFFIDSTKASVIENQLASVVKSGVRSTAGLQLPQTASQQSPSNFRSWFRTLRNPDSVHSIADEGSPVKGGIVSQTATRQFKNWFGGSKVVDANGEPLVVYRGAEYDPLAQEPGKGVIKPEAYFTADPEYAKRYAGSEGKVRAYYLNIRHPFDIRDPECQKDFESVYPGVKLARGKSGALDWAEAATVDGEFLKENFGDKYDGIIFDEASDWAPEGNLPKWRGISYVPLDGGAQVKSATDNIGTFDSGNPDVRFAVGGQVVGDFVIGTDGTMARRGTPQAAMLGRARVADDAGYGEQTPGSMAAALERLNQPRTTLKTIGTVRPMSLPLSEMEFLRKYLTGDHLPATVARKIAGGGFAAHTKSGRLTIAADVFGLVDKTDVAPAKERLKEHGFFRNEDEAWAANHSPAEVRRERERSEGQLGDELLKLADRRARGAEAGGESAARGVYANELAKIVMDMPRKEGGVIGRVQKIGDAVRANVKAIAGERGTGCLPFIQRHVSCHGVCPFPFGSPARGRTTRPCMKGSE